MSDENPNVEIKSDHGSESLGNSAYLKAQDGKFESQGYRSSMIVMIVLVLLVFLSMKMTSKRDKGQKSGKEFAAPTVNHENPSLNPKLLTEKDLTNIISRPKVQSSVLGKIKVVNLAGTSEIPVGTEAKAILESGATDGIVKARLISSLIVDGEPLLPENAILFGKGRSADERLMVEFQKIILPSGESILIWAQALDLSDRILGLKGSVVGTKTRKMVASMGFGLLGGMADGLQETSGSSVFSVGQRKSLRDAALSGASKAALDQSQAYIEEMKKSPNIIEVKAGTEFVILIDEPKKKNEEFYESK